MYLISGWVAYASVSLYYHGSVKGCNLIVNHNVKALCTTNSSPLCFPWWLHVKSVAFVSALEFEAGYLFRWGFPAGSAVKKNLSAVREMQVWSLGGEDPLEEEMATHSSILAWRIPWTEKPSGLQFMGHKQSDTTEWLTHICQALFFLIMVSYHHFTS